MTTNDSRYSDELKKEVIVKNNEKSYIDCSRIFEYNEKLLVKIKGKIAPKTLNQVIKKIQVTKHEK